MAHEALSAIGWGPFFEGQVSPDERALLAGRVVEERGPRLAVRFDDGERLVTVPGRLRAAGEARSVPAAEPRSSPGAPWGARSAPAAEPRSSPGAPWGVPSVGDFVLAAPGEEPPLIRVLARRSSLSRGAAGRVTAEQVLAANVDLVFLVQGLDAGVKPRRIERTLAAVYASGAEPVVLLTKADLEGDPAAALEEAAAAARGVTVLAVSVPAGLGVEEVRALLAPGRTGVFVGASGGGKSTLVNALAGALLQATAEVRERDARGRHTTTGRRLVALPGGGAVIDGPGIRELKLWDADGIEEVFDEVAALAAGCRFRDCAHEDEPGCAVRAAVEDGRIDPARLESLRKLEAEARAAEARRSGAAARAEKQRWRAISREIRRFYKDRGRE